MFYLVRFSTFNVEADVQFFLELNHWKASSEIPLTVICSMPNIGEQFRGRVLEDFFQNSL